jgi:uncharacterized protein YndB with AHSA1/START domain
MENQPIILERVFDAPISKVWKAITNKDEMKLWYFDLAEFKAEVGFKFQFLGGDTNGKQYLHLCEITEMIPEKKLTYSWKYDGYDGISFVSFELAKHENGTKLKLTHTGLETFPHENPDFAKGNFEAGWNYIVNTGLKDYLAKTNVY